MLDSVNDLTAIYTYASVVQCECNEALERTECSVKVYVVDKTIVISIHLDQTHPHVEKLQLLTKHNYSTLRKLDISDSDIYTYLDAYNIYSSVKETNLYSVLKEMRQDDFAAVITYSSGIGCWVSCLLAIDVDFLGCISADLKTDVTLVLFDTPNFTKWGFSKLIKLVSSSSHVLFPDTNVNFHLYKFPKL
jgi:hypothetical protein